MTKQLIAKPLDVVITKITAKTVYYQLIANGAEASWRIPTESTFDKSVLRVGQRYRVITRVIRSKQWDRWKCKRVYADRYDWVFAEQLSAVAPCTVRSKNVISAAASLLPLVDAGTLFKW